MKTQPFPPPYLGQRDDIPLAIIENPYAEVVQNYLLDNGTPTLRHGDNFWTGSSGNVGLHLATYGFGSTQKMFLCYDVPGVDIKFADVSTENVFTVVSTVASSGGDDEVHSLFYNNYLYFFGEFSLLPAGAGVPYYDGTSWGVTAWSMPSGYANPFGGAVFKNRGYFIERNSSKYVYTKVDRVQSAFTTAGELTGIDLSGIISAKGNLYGIRSIALSEGIQQENVLAFIFETGEVLVYAGTYPDSDTWRIVGRFIIPRMMYYHTIIDAKGDSYIVTESALVSLRTLFLSGIEAAVQNGISFHIKNRWKQVMQAVIGDSSFAYIRGVYDSVNDRLIVSIPKNVDRATGVLDSNAYLRLIYSFKTDSWYEEVVQTLTGQAFADTMAFYKGKAFYSSYYDAGVMQVEGRSNYVDDQYDQSTAKGIDYQLRTAPLAINRFGTNSINGFEAILKTDLYTQTSYKFIADLGRKTTDAQILTDQGSSVINPMLNVGIVSNYVQLDISGTTTSASSIGQILYAFNLWYDSGQEGSR